MFWSHRLKEGVVFITGASSGIGAALAEEFVRKKFKVVLLGRRAELLEKVARLCDPTGQNVFPLEADVNDPQSLENAVRKTLDRFKSIDIVIANAGFGVAGPFEKLKTEDYRRQFDTNVFGVLETLRKTLEALKASKGQFVVMGSVAGYLAAPNASAYSMSKFAVRALTESIRPELKSYGIQVTHIAPGFVDSQIHQVDRFGTYRPQKPVVIPHWLIMNTQQAAHEMLKGILARRNEILITTHGKLIVFLKQYLPTVLKPFEKMALKQDLQN